MGLTLQQFLYKKYPVLQLSKVGAPKSNTTTRTSRLAGHTIENGSIGYMVAITSECILITNNK
jgi:hypothetical protein